MLDAKAEKEEAEWSRYRKSRASKQEVVRSSQNRKRKYDANSDAGQEDRPPTVSAFVRFDTTVERRSHAFPVCGQIQSVMWSLLEYIDSTPMIFRHTSAESGLVPFGLSPERCVALLCEGGDSTMNYGRLTSSSSSSSSSSPSIRVHRSRVINQRSLIQRL
ncbi:hypothetical protein F2P81_017479 [Scophthalmus maximus]|uniref:Uncharacterized protein n=1 Tax=Scophthalmus maximus TaxID=52904 RepID=A0A6A4SET9_SCOMX|nr:hypothetical protein F2P81_017479 [Scophthalmus maximus]